MYQLLTRVVSPCRFPWRCAQMPRMFMSHRELYYRQSKDKGIYSLFIWWNNVGFSCCCRCLCPLGRVHKAQKLPWQEVCVADTLCADLLINVVSSWTHLASLPALCDRWDRCSLPKKLCLSLQGMFRICSCTLWVCASCTFLHWDYHGGTMDVRSCWDCPSHCQRWGNGNPPPYYLGADLYI
jgi:hypothetical protein